MGVVLSSLSFSAPSPGEVGSLVSSELPEVAYDKTLSHTRFLKTIRARQAQGYVIIKVFIKPVASFDLKTYIELLDSVQTRLSGLHNTLPYLKIIKTERAGYLFRQYLYASLYDRISTRPFLDLTEKKWVAFQLLSALAACHARDVRHGDIKSENVLVTSWNWIYLADFASFKPTYLPEDNPADFGFFFDTSARRICYVAPERFLAPDDENKSDDLTDAMDIFSVGCVIAELFLEGTPLFTLSQLLNYRQGNYDPVHSYVNRIEDEGIRSLVQHMIQLDPDRRFSAERYLIEWKNLVFPDYFSTFLHGYMGSITELGPSIKDYTVISDERILRIYQDFDKIAFFLGFRGDCTDAPPDDRSSCPKTLFPVTVDLPNYSSIKRAATSLHPNYDGGALIFLSLTVSCLRNTLRPTPRVQACDVILALSDWMTDEDKLDRCLPYLMMVVKDPVPSVRIAALRAVTHLLASVQVLAQINCQIFTDYILPKLQNFPSDADVLVRSIYAACFPVLIDTAQRYLDLSQSLRSASASYDTSLAGPSSNVKSLPSTFDSDRRELIAGFEAHLIVMLADTNSVVRRSLMSSISPLCMFFGKQKTSDVILSHLITSLNDHDSDLRGAFFETIVGIATYIGARSFEEYILPLMVQAFTDTDEFVVEKVINSFTSLCEFGILHLPSIRDLSVILVRLTLHPNIWIREASVAFLATAARRISKADLHCFLLPIINPFLLTQTIDLSELTVLELLKAPMNRVIFDSAVNWASRSERTKFWKRLKEQNGSPGRFGPVFFSKEARSATAGIAQLNIDSSEKVLKSAEDESYLSKLRGLGLIEEDEWKLAVLRPYLWRLAANLFIDRKRQIQTSVIVEPLKAARANVGNDKRLNSLLSTLINENSVEADIDCGPSIARLSGQEPIRRNNGQICHGNWRAEGNLIAHFSEHNGAVIRVAVAPDHTFFITGSEDGTVKVWDSVRLEKNVVNRSRLTYRHSPGSKVRAICFLEQLHCFASAASDGAIHIVRVRYHYRPEGPKYGKLTLLRSYSLQQGEYATWLEHYRLDGKSMLAISTNFSRVIGVDIVKMEILWELKSKAQYGVPTCFLVDSLSRSWILIGTSRGVLDLWDLRFQLKLKSWALPGNTPIRRMQMHPTRGQGRWICVAGGCANGETTVWDIEQILCREVYTPFEPTHADNQYERRSLDELRPEILYDHLKTDIETSGRKVKQRSQGVESLCVGFNPVQVETGSTNYGDRGFIICGGPGCKVRFWNLNSPSHSAIISGFGKDDPLPSYHSFSPTPTLLVVGEKAEPKSGGAHGRRLSKQATSRSFISSSQQQILLRNHLDFVLDVAFLVKPFGMVISVDRGGIIKVYN